MATTGTASPLAALNTAILLQVMSNLTYVDEICLALTSHHFYDQVKFNNMPPSTKASFKLSQLCPRPDLFLVNMYRDGIPFSRLMRRLSHWLPRDDIRKLLTNEKAWLRSLPVKKGVYVQVVTSWDHVYGNRFSAEMESKRIFDDTFGHLHEDALSSIAKGLLEMGTTMKELDAMGISHRYIKYPTGR